MARGLQLGRVLGVRITLDWSVIVIVLLVTFQLGAVVLPQWHPDWTAALTWSIALGAALLLLVSILIHELAHAVVAIAHKIPVRSITLFVFGGMANIERRPPHARAEFLMALVGPLTSFALGIGAVALSGWLSGWAVLEADDPVAAARSLGPAATLLAWLGPINVLLAIFNMIPGYPLDGGRVLRALLWWVTGSLGRATKIAAGFGRGVAWMFIVLGIAMIFGISVPFFGTGLGGGLWLVLIGWFLNTAATASYQQELVERLLEDVQVRDLMSTGFSAISPTTTVADLVEQRLMREDQRAYPVVDHRRFLGLVCLEDVRKVPRNQWASTPVRQIMTSAERVDVVRPTDEAIEAVKRLGRRDVGQVPVVENGELRGLFRRQDFLRWVELQRDPDEVRRDRGTSSGAAASPLRSHA